MTLDEQVSFVASRVARAKKIAAKHMDTGEVEKAKPWEDQADRYLAILISLNRLVALGEGL